MDDIKTIHELLDTNGVGLPGEPLLARVSDVVAEWKQLKLMREAMQKAIWDDHNVRLALEELCHDHFDGCPCKGCAALEATLGKKCCLCGSREDLFEWDNGTTYCHKCAEKNEPYL